VGHNSGKTIIADVDMLAALLFSFFIFIMQAKLLLEVDTVLLCTVGYPDAKPIFLLINFFFVSYDAGKTIADVDMVLLCSGVSPNTSFISPDKLNEKVFSFPPPYFFFLFWVGTNFLKPKTNQTAPRISVHRHLAPVIEP
jgi:hypothetical protein